jgi:hypothetical protein
MQIWLKSLAFGNNCMILYVFEAILNTQYEITIFLYEYCRTQLSLVFLSVKEAFLLEFETLP